jgi:hypothetical protein
VRLFFCGTMQLSIPQRQIKFLSKQCEGILLAILEKLELSAKIDPELVEELTMFFLRDIYRIDQQQRGSVSLAKTTGYWAFWIRKLKPIKDAKLTKNSSFNKNELTYVNEVVAIQFAMELVTEFRESGGFTDVVREECNRRDGEACNGVACFGKYVGNYLSFHDEFFKKYLTYSMRNRTFGPHHFAILIENIIYASCRKLSVGA